MRTTGQRRPLATFWLLALIVAIGVNLRAMFGAVPPLVPEISAELDLSATEAGLLTSAPVLLMGLCAPFGQRLAARLGQEPAMVAFLTLLAITALSRLVVDGAVVLVLTATVIGGAMGALSSLVPAFIGHHLPRLRGTATGVFSTSMALGVGLAAGVTRPLSDLLGGWRPSLATWGVAAAIVAVALLVLLPRLATGPEPASDHRVLPTPSVRGGTRRTWLVAATTSVMMMLGFSTIAWLSPSFEHAGMDPARAALMFVLFQGVQVFSMLTLPPLTDVLPGKRLVFGIVLVATSAGLLLLVVAPVSMAIPASLLAGFGIGGGSSLALVLIQYAATSREEANRISAVSMLVAYSAAAAGPLALGALRDLTGGFTVGFAVLLALSLASFALLVPLGALRTVAGADSGEHLAARQDPC